MMKKIPVILMIAALAIFVASAAIAGVSGTRHDMTSAGMNLEANLAAGGGMGVCSACHIPHGAEGKRLFPGSTSGNAGEVGNLCATCHLDQTNIVTSNTSTLMLDPVANPTVHRYDQALYTGEIAEGGNLATSGMPYADGSGDIECTSCHNPHTDQFRPFMRVAVDVLCQNCHQGREEALSMAANVSGSHVIGAAYDGSNTRPVTFPTRLSVAYGPGLPTNTTAGERWVLGGHRTSGATGGVQCITCHIVHGYDAETPTVGAQLAPPANDVLPYAFTSGTTNPICEACHGTNPGLAGSNAHPVQQADGLGEETGNALELEATLGVGVAKDGSSATYLAGTAIVCVTCHDTHLGKPNTPALGDFTGVAAGGAFCEVCHLTTRALPDAGGVVDDVITGATHHPRSTSPSMGATVNLAGRSPFATDDVVECITCHRAHNAPPQGTIPSPAFLLTAVNYDGGTNQPSSVICLTCHGYNPSVYTTGVTGADNEGSHFVGDVSATGIDPTKGGTNPDPRKITSWAAGKYTAGTNVYSKYANTDYDWGTTAPTLSANSDMICESCHSVTNPREDPLLLGGFDTATPSENNQICEDCHSVPAGTHPTETATVTRPDPDRTISVSAGQSATPDPWVDAAVTGDVYYANDTITCGSCHRPHDADTNAAGYILRRGFGTGSYGTVTNNEWDPDVTGFDYTDLCAGCHSQYR